MLLISNSMKTFYCFCFSACWSCIQIPWFFLFFFTVSVCFSACWWWCALVTGQWLSEQKPEKEAGMTTVLCLSQYFFSNICCSVVKADFILYVFFSRRAVCLGFSQICTILAPPPPPPFFSPSLFSPFFLLFSLLLSQICFSLFLMAVRWMLSWQFFLSFI